MLTEVKVLEFHRKWAALTPGEHVIPFPLRRSRVSEAPSGDMQDYPMLRLLINAWGERH